MRKPHCLGCAREKARRARVEGENAGLKWAIQKARGRMRAMMQEVDAVASMLDARLQASGDRRRGDAIAERAA